MDYKTVDSCDDRVYVRDVINFKLKDIFECGQCFRFEKQASGSYIIIAFNRVIELELKDEDLIIHNSSLSDFENIWENYFDLRRDYSSIKKELSKDPVLQEAIKFGEGIRILNQEPFENLISFIISSNNRIPMIKKCIENISRRWGNAVTYKGITYYTFPNLSELHETTLKELQECKTGFRAKYIKETVEKLYYNKECSDLYEFGLDLDWIKKQEDDVCHQELLKFSGVGPKVADCIMLFSMGKYSSFPVDVWVKRAMQYFYVAPDVSLKKIREFARNKFGNLSGFAQQYLFYYARENNISIS